MTIGKEDNQLVTTLATNKLFVCIADSIILTVPFQNIAEMVAPQGELIFQTNQRRFLNWREQMIPIYQLSQLLDRSLVAKKNDVTAKYRPTSLLIYCQSDRALALELKIERLIADPELKIESFAEKIARLRYCYGYTMWQERESIPVIDGAILLDAALKDESASDRSQTLQKSVSSPIVLVVDDCMSVRLALFLMLQKAGYKVLQARDGWDAIEQLYKHPNVRLIVCDIEMPNMSGFEFLIRRRQDPYLSAIPVVMLSSRTDEQHQDMTLHLGAKAYFTKPYVETEFLAALKALI